MVEHVLAQICTSFLDSMKTELDLLELFKALEIRMKESIQLKDWQSLQTVMKEMVDLSDRMVVIERKRQDEYERLRTGFGVEENAGFYQVIVHLPRELRDELAGLYRNMKFTVLSLQAVTECMDDQVRSVNSTIHEILGELFPHRKGNLYSKEGKSREVDPNPVVVNQHS